MTNHNNRSARRKRAKRKRQKMELQQQQQQQLPSKKQRQQENAAIIHRQNGTDDDDDDDELLLAAAAAAWAQEEEEQEQESELPAQKKQRRRGSNPNNGSTSSSRTCSSSGGGGGGGGEIQHKNQQLQQQQRRRRNNQQQPFYPPPFPPAGPLQSQIPKHTFLRNNNNMPTTHVQAKAFQAALDTAYESFVWDDPSDLKTVGIDQDTIQTALQTLDCAGYFRTDVTQPAGLGGKCVKTYVTRCLLGDPGTTYKYLGLRMFAHPWNQIIRDPDSSKKQAATAAAAAIQTIFDLNQSLTQQTQKHLQSLAQKRLARNEVANPSVKGRAGFHVTLINKMKVLPRLKPEPMFEDQKCSVSWHADSSLEHYSTIAVYQMIVNDNKNINNSSKRLSSQHQEQDCWSVALRVTHDAEGPHAKRLSDIAVEDSSPAIAVTLPTGSAYYMLDDCNHHHQHAVLAPALTENNNSIRFSSTHRLLRQGHTVQDMLKSCEKVVQNFHRHGPKRWKAEQAVLNQLEMEWLRQFFIQGAVHKKLHWPFWHEPILQLFQYWEQLEARTRQVLLILKHASEEKCGVVSSSDDDSLHQKRAQALALLLPMLQGGGNIVYGKEKASSSTLLYNTFADILLERAQKRQLWLQREQDAIFKRMPAGCRPIPFPARFWGEDDDDAADNNHATGQQQDYQATSIMPDGKHLTKLASHVRTWGICFENQCAKQLPKVDFLQSASK